MRRLVLVAIAAVACGKGHGEERDLPVAAAAPPAPVVAAPRDPWLLAPAGTVVAIVARPGALGKFGAGWLAVERLLGSRPETVDWGRRLAQLRRRLPVAAIDRDGLSAAGLDPDGGAGLFLDQRAALLLAVLPVRDAARFAAAAGGEPIGGDWRVAGMLCGARAVGFVCGADVGGIAAALAGGDPVLRKRVALLPAAVRGELELVGDLAAMPDMAGVRARLGALVAGAGLVVASARAAGTLELRLWIEGDPAPPWGTLLAEPSASPPLDELERGAASGLRVSLALPQLLAFLLPPTAVPERPDLALPGLCRELGALGPVLRAEPGRCTLRIDLPSERLGHPLAAAAFELIRGRELEIAVDRDLVSITSGGGPAGPRRPPIAALGGEPWQLRAWATDLELPAAIPQLDAIRLVADRVAGVALGVRLDASGFHLRLAAQVSDER